MSRFPAILAANYADVTKSSRTTGSPLTLTKKCCFITEEAPNAPVTGGHIHMAGSSRKTAVVHLVERGAAYLFERIFGGSCGFGRVREETPYALAVTTVKSFDVVSNAVHFSC